MEKLFLYEIKEAKVLKPAVVKGDFLAILSGGLVCIVRVPKGKELKKGEKIKTKITAIRNNFALGELVGN